MGSKRHLLLSLGALLFIQLNSCLGQLRNRTLQAQGIDVLDYYDPEIYNANTTRIVGGRPINIEQVPWQVALYDNGYLICGGSLISVDWVLTAAHCVEDGGRFAVRAGSTYANRGGQVRGARVAYIHSSYNSFTGNIDIALIQLQSSFEINKSVRPIPLAKRNRSLPERYFVSGWGTLRENGSGSNRLRGVTINKITRPECRRKYAVENIGITEYMICASASGKDSCQGDSGGPLVRDRIQYGVVSFGIGCARPEYPGVYTNTRKLNQWIRGVIRSQGGEMPTFA